MVSIEQIKVLEAKVHAAVEKIQALDAENRTLKAKLGDYETRVLELQERVESFQSDQSVIEQGILSALKQLDQLEDQVGRDEEVVRGGGFPETPAPQTPSDGEGSSRVENAPTRNAASSTDEAAPHEPEQSDPEPDTEDPELDIF
jgi:chromosome segregation ATPase